ncbi:hypothetical protein [Kaustia mangrovi]
MIGVTRQALHRYKVGARIPRPAIMARIESVTGGSVRANDFHSTATDDRRRSKASSGANAPNIAASRVDVTEKAREALP